MAELENPLMAAISKNLQHETLSKLGELIDEYVTEETSWTKSAVAQRQQECFAVRPGVDGTLDAVRKVRWPGTHIHMLLFVQLLPCGSPCVCAFA